MSGDGDASLYVRKPFSMKERTEQTRTQKHYKIQQNQQNQQQL